MVTPEELLAIESRLDALLSEDEKAILDFNRHIHDDMRLLLNHAWETIPQEPIPLIDWLRLRIHNWRVQRERRHLRAVTKQWHTFLAEEFHDQNTKNW